MWYSEYLANICVLILCKRREKEHCDAGLVLALYLKYVVLIKMCCNFEENWKYASIDKFSLVMQYW